MTEPLFAPYPVAEIAGPLACCFIFAWIGQSFESCDECGRPNREHLYRPTYGDERPDLYVKHYVKYLRRWEWRPVVVQRHAHVAREAGGDT